MKTTSSQVEVKRRGDWKMAVVASKQTLEGGSGSQSLMLIATPAGNVVKIVSSTECQQVLGTICSDDGVPSML